MVSLSEVDTGLGRALPVSSLWSILQSGFQTGPNQVALMAPAQPSDHLRGLVKPFSTSVDQHHAASSSFHWHRLTALLTRFVSRLLLPAPSSGDTLVWTFAQLRCAAIRIGSAIDANGIPAGARVLILLPSCAEWAVMLWVSALKRHTLITLDTTVLEKGNEQKLQDYIAKLKPSVFVVPSQKDAAAVDYARNIINDHSHFMGISVAPLAKSQPNWTSMPDISMGNCPGTTLTFDAPTVDDFDRVALIIYTGGTSTGTPKGCVRTVGDLLHTLTAGGSLPVSRPPFMLVNTKSSQSLAPCLLYSTWYSGNAAVLAGGSFNAKTTISTLATSRPVAAALYPHMVDLIYQHADFSPEKMKSVRVLMVIGSVTPVESIKRAQMLFPKARILASYGMTEAAGIFGWPSGLPQSEAIPAHKHIVSCGLPLPGVKIKIVDEGGNIIGRNNPGILHLCGDMVATGYLEPNGVPSFYEEDGNRWYVTGDCAVLDDDGRIYILGRHDFMIRRNGHIISPATIENVLMKHFPQSTVVVVGLTEHGGNDLVYAVFHKEIQNHLEVKGLVVKELGISYHLDGVFDLPQLGLEDWPYTIVGKLSIVDMRRIVKEKIASCK